MEELDLTKIFQMFWSKKVQIMLILVLFVIIGQIYGMYFVRPMYKASTTLILARTESEKDQSITQTELTLNQKLVSTYSQLIKSKAVLQQVISNLALPDLTEESLKKSITVTALQNTELIEIAVTHENGMYVDMIANEVGKVFMDKIIEIYNISNVHVVSSAERATKPYNLNNSKYALMAGLVGALLAMTYVVIINILDNTIETSDEIENRLGTLVLATIPKYNFEKESK